MSTIVFEIHLTGPQPAPGLAHSTIIMNVCMAYHTKCFRMHRQQWYFSSSHPRLLSLITLFIIADAIFMTLLPLLWPCLAPGHPKPRLRQRTLRRARLQHRQGLPQQRAAGRLQQKRCTLCSCRYGMEWRLKVAAVCPTEDLSWS